jgi:hypothetical protein
MAASMQNKWEDHAAVQAIYGNQCWSFHVSSTTDSTSIAKSYSNTNQQHTRGHILIHKYKAKTYKNRARWWQDFPPYKTSLDLFKETRVEKMHDTQVDRDDKHTYTLQANQSKRVMQNSWQMQAMMCKQGKLYYSTSNRAINSSRYVRPRTMSSFYPDESKRAEKMLELAIPSLFRFGWE